MEIKLLYLLILSISFYYSIQDFPKLSKQGMFSAGGSVLHSDGTFDVSNYYTSRTGSTSHVDHANVFYQIP